MIRAVFIALMLFSAPSFAQKPWDIAAAEARPYLGKCDLTDATARDLCRNAQVLFMHQYAAAKALDELAIFFVASYFSPPGSGVFAIAVPPRPIEACAWWGIYSIASGRSPQAVQTVSQYCDPLSRADYTAALSLARKLDPSFNRAYMPPDDWKVTIP